MACFFEVFRTLLKCSPIWAQKANACTILELSRLFWYPYHLWKWLSSVDIAVFKIFLQIFLLQRHLVTVFHKWKINFKVFLIDLVPFRYFSMHFDDPIRKSVSLTLVEIHHYGRNRQKICQCAVPLGPGSVGLNSMFSLVICEIQNCNFSNWKYLTIYCCWIRISFRWNI